MSRFSGFLCRAGQIAGLNRLRQDKPLQQFWLAKRDNGFLVAADDRGNVKQALIKIGCPVKDLCGYVAGAPFEMTLRLKDQDGRPFALRDYQIEAVDAFYQSGRARGGSLIIYDEVHLLPAPVFRATTNIQAKRRLGLTATLVREDGKEEDVFALIGPKRYDVPWKVLENRGYIAEAICTEYRLPLPYKEELVYAQADKRQKFRIASENSRKIELAEELIMNHPDDSILVIGQYIDQLEKLAEDLNLPLITGKTRNEEREALYSDFKAGRLK